MKVVLTERGWTDYLFWQEGERNRDILNRINTLIREIQRTPFPGIGKPEPLVGNFRGWWSRRITSDHRIVYHVIGQGDDQRIEILACRYHYSPRR
jgi:toxin YoeB